MKWIVHEPDDLMEALDAGRLVLRPVTLQWQREYEALVKDRELELERERRKQKRKAS